MDLVSAELPAKTLIVGIDPGKAVNRVLLATGEKGMLGKPVSLPTQREGVERLCGSIAEAGAPQTVIAIASAFGAPTGVRMTSILSPRKTSSKPPLNLVSLSRIKNRAGVPRSESSQAKFRACCAA